MKKNIFWRAYKKLQGQEKQNGFNEKLECEKIPKSTFYKHMKMSIEKIPFKYILFYGKALDLKISNVAKEFSNEYSDLFVNKCTT